MSEMAALPAIPLASNTANYTSIGIASAFLLVSWIAVSLRVYVRALLIRSFSWDDRFIVVALAAYTLQCSATIYVSWIEIGPGLSEYEWLSKLVLVLILISAVYACTSIFLKLSLAYFFLRIVRDKGQRWLIRIFVGMFVAVAAAFFFVFLFQCGDPSKFLERELKGRCISRIVITDMLYLHGALNAATDWMFAILPTFFLRHTQMPRKTKICVCLLLALGTVGSIASLVRMAYISALDSSTDEAFRAFVKPSILSNVESGLGITASSFATLRPLVKLWQEKSRSGWSWSRKSRSRHESDGQEEGSWVQLEVTVSSQKRQAQPVPYDPLDGSRDVGNNTYIITEPITFPSGIRSPSYDTSPVETASIYSKSPVLVSTSRSAMLVRHDTDNDLEGPRKKGLDVL